ncbi:MAG: right-handed parallel beta-helix repeat-containing protein, partial [Kiritimatiellales bacterium]|nr:right-handed parallel beta-helix repeat-containing protein [Kiritimatiellales bacterium]
MKCCSFKLGILPVFLLLAGCYEPGKPVPVQQDKPMQFHVRDFGVEPSSTNNYEELKAAVAAAKTNAGPVELQFEPGVVYRIGFPDGPNLQSKYALYVQGATNLVLNGQGATLLITNPEIGGICTEDSTGVEVKNFNIDYDPLPYAQGVITTVNLPESWFELKVDEGFMEPDQVCFERSMSKWGLTIRDLPDGRRRYGPAAVFAERWEKTGDRIWRFYTPRNGNGYDLALSQAGLKPGDRYIHQARNYAQAVAAKNCDNVLWENITVYSSPGLAFFPHITSYHTIRNCHVKVKEGRIFSTDADGIHMRSSRGHVLIEDCSFAGMSDDGINVHSSALSVQSRPAPDQVMVKKHTFSVRPGDALELVHSASATVDGTYIVKVVQDAGATWLLTLDRDLPELAAGSEFSETDNFYNLSESANPFIIRNCYFGDYRGRGILVSAHGGLIEKNIFEMNDGWGIVMNYESTRWAEGPVAYDLIVRDNEFRGRGSSQAAILGVLYGRSQTGGDMMASVPSRPFHDIQIENNRFYDYGVPAIELSSARNVTISDNLVRCSDAAVRARSEYAAVVLRNCEAVQI